MTKLSKEEMIDILIDDWFNSIREEGPQLLTYVFLSGFKGYNNMTYKQVQVEYDAAIGEMNG